MVFTRIAVQVGVSEGRRRLMLCENHDLISSGQLDRTRGGRVEVGLVEI